MNCNFKHFSFIKSHGDGSIPILADVSCIYDKCINEGIEPEHVIKSKYHSCRYTGFTTL